MAQSGPQPLYELAPVNGRDASIQAHYYGYASVDHLAADLPAGARVIDVGAGITNLGKEVAVRRPDISWVYFDRCYSSQELLRQAQGNDTPPNVSFTNGDITRIEESGLAAGSFDRVFSSRLVPHIDMESPELARLALSNMASLLRADGDMRILRRFYPFLRDRLLGRAGFVHVTRQELEEKGNSVLEHALAHIRLPRFYRWKQILHNVHATAHFGRAQWSLPDAKGRARPARGLIWDPQHETFVPRRSLRGHQLYGGFILRALRDPFPAPYYRHKKSL